MCNVTTSLTLEICLFIYQVTRYCIYDPGYTLIIVVLLVFYGN